MKTSTCACTYVEYTHHMHTHVTHSHCSISACCLIIPNAGYVLDTAISVKSIWEFWLKWAQWFWILESCSPCCAHFLSFVSYLIGKHGVIQSNWRPELAVSQVQASPGQSRPQLTVVYKWGDGVVLVKPSTVLLQFWAAWVGLVGTGKTGIEKGGFRGITWIMETDRSWRGWEQAQQGMCEEA